jgi:creatinine amidohydrolase
MESFQSVRAEFMRPSQIRQALAIRSVAFLPIGATEFHQEHLPIGLDGLNAQGVACEAALERGGIVLPTLFVGTGGGHKDYPWTIMMDGDAEIRAILQKTLQRLNEFGVKVAVLFTGHFAPEQLEMIESIASDWQQTGRSMKVLALAINMPLESAIAPDHAGVFETTVLSKFFKETIDLGGLPSLSDFPAIDPQGDPYGLHRHDPEHVLWGVFGPDPRKYDSAAADALVGKLTLEINAAVDLAIA